MCRCPRRPPPRSKRIPSPNKTQMRLASLSPKLTKESSLGFVTGRIVPLVLYQGELSPWFCIRENCPLGFVSGRIVPWFCIRENCPLVLYQGDLSPWFCIRETCPLGFVSGHDLGRAANGPKSNGLQPLKSFSRPSRCFEGARLQPCRNDQSNNGLQPLRDGSRSPSQSPK